MHHTTHDILPFLTHALRLYDAKHPLPPHTGYQVTITSSIPLGAGMGSSAAILISLYRAFNQYFKITMDASALHTLVTEAEHFQHGHSSGLDAALCLGSGCQLYHQGEWTRLPPWQSKNIQVVFTGQPANNTHACIAHCQPIFENNKRLVDHFETITCDMRKQLAKSSPATEHDLKPLIQKNHALLVTLGVVPPKIQDLIQSLENAGCAGKISGAGAIEGSQAGTLWVAGNASKIHAIACEYGFEHAWIPLHDDN